MAKSLKTFRIVPRAARRRPEEAEVRRLTERFHDIDSIRRCSAVDICIELGEILDEGRALLGRGYGRWLREQLGLSRAAAECYGALAELCRREPGSVHTHKDLGPAKLVRLARLDPDRRARLLRRQG